MAQTTLQMKRRAPVADKEDREAVSHRVGADPHMVQARAATVPLELLVERRRGGPLAEPVQPHPTVIREAGALQGQCATGEVRLQARGAGGREADQPLSCTLAHHSQREAGEVHVPQAQPEGLGQAKAGVQQEQDEREVAQSDERRGVGLAEEGFEVRQAECGDDLARLAELAEASGGADGDKPLPLCPVEEAAEDHAVLVDARGLYPRLPVGDEGADVGLGHFVDPVAADRPGVLGEGAEGVPLQDQVGRAQSTEARLQQERLHGVFEQRRGGDGQTQYGGHGRLPSGVHRAGAKLVTLTGNQPCNIVSYLAGASKKARKMGLDRTTQGVYLEGLVSFCFVRVRVPPSAPAVSNAGRALDARVGG